MTMVGADPQSLRRIARELARQAEQLRTSRAAIDRLVDGVQWVGPDARDFHHRWHGDSARRVLAAAEHLSEMSQTCLRNADAQERTSGTLDGAALAGLAAAGWTAATIVGGVVEGARGAAQRADDEGLQRNTQTSRDQETGVDQRPGQPDGTGFQAGPPTRPQITWDEGYAYGTEEPTWGDRLNLEKWKALATGAAVLKGLDDGAAMYLHYASNSGADVTYDLGEAYREDDGMRASINWEMANTAAAADRLAVDGGAQQITGPAHLNLQYPTTENWQKAVGGHQQWSSAEVTRQGDTITMTVTVHAEDHYNFNPGQQDIASQTPDSENGRFTTVGLAKPFDSHGTYTRTVSWKAGQPPAPGSFS